GHGAPRVVLGLGCVAGTEASTPLGRGEFREDRGPLSAWPFPPRKGRKGQKNRHLPKRKVTLRVLAARPSRGASNRSLPTASRAGPRSAAPSRQPLMARGNGRARESCNKGKTPRSEERRVGKESRDQRSRP